MNAHTNTTTAARNAKSVKIGSPALSGTQPSGKALDTAAVPVAKPATSAHLTNLIAAVRAAEEEHDQHFDTDVPDGGQAACMSAIDKIEKAMEAVCAYHPAPNDREAWGDFLRQQFKAGYWVKDESRVEAMLTAMVRNVTSSPATVGFDSNATDLPEVQMGWLVRSFRDAAMQIDPTIRGFWVSNTVDEDLGATSYHGITFNRRASRDFEKLRATYLASGRLEPLDLDGLGPSQLIDLFKALDDYHCAVNVFLSADAFHTFNDKGRAIGSTWNGEMAEVLREWSEDAHDQILEAIRASKPKDSHDSYCRAMFLAWREAEIGGNLTDIANAVAASAAEQLALGEGFFGGEEGATALSIMAEFAELDEAGQEALLAAARDLVAQKQAA